MRLPKKNDAMRLTPRTFWVFLIVVVLSNKFFTPDFACCLECIDTDLVSTIRLGTDQPSDVAYTKKGDAYIVDGVNNRIVVLTKDGKEKFTFGTEGGRNGEFSLPKGIDISDDDRVFVADTENRRIQVFDLSGNFIFAFPINKGPSDRHPPDPVDVLASNYKGGYLFVTDNENHKVKVYDNEGLFLYEWGKYGEGPGEFRYPAFITANEYNEVYVSDVLNTRVQRFQPDGVFLDKIGKFGVLQGRLFRPKGVAVDKEDRVFVADSYMGVIQVFTSLGRFLGVLCDGTQKQVFNTPVGIILDLKRNRLSILEMRGNRITILKIKL